MSRFLSFVGIKVVLQSSQWPARITITTLSDAHAFWDPTERPERHRWDGALGRIPTSQRTQSAIQLGSRSSSALAFGTGSFCCGLRRNLDQKMVDFQYIFFCFQKAGRTGVLYRPARISLFTTTIMMATESLHNGGMLGPQIQDTW